MLDWIQLAAHTMVANDDNGNDNDGWNMTTGLYDPGQRCLNATKLIKNARNIVPYK